jgi:membrane protease YdiL (CAAX protease family)
MPGLSEELAFRGVILALLDRAFTARFSLGGAKIGYGAIVVTIFFGLEHGVFIGDDLNFHTSWLSGVYAAAVGCVLVWLRLRTGSIVVPVFVHNGLNVVPNVVLRMT